MIYEATIYNFGFMGSGREGEFGGGEIDGHVTLVFDETHFMVAKLLDYGGLTWVGGEKKFGALNPSDIRRINDVLLDVKPSKFHEAEPDMVKLFKSGIKYERTNKSISANIDYGDEVINTETGEKFVVNGNHDIRTINRNQFYHLVDRPELAPKKLTKNEFISLLNGVDIWKGWKPTEQKENSKKLFHRGSLTVNSGAEYRFYYNSDSNRYYVYYNNIALELFTHISAPFYDTIDKLIGLVHCKYDNGNPVYYHLFDVVSEPSKSCSFSDDYHIYKRLTKFDEAESYHYNNGTIKMGLI